MGFVTGFCLNFKADYYKNAVNKRIIEHHTPTTLSSVKPPFLWCVSGITTKKVFQVRYAMFPEWGMTAVLCMPVIISSAYKSKSSVIAFQKYYTQENFAYSTKNVVEKQENVTNCNKNAFLLKKVYHSPCNLK